MNWTKNKRAQKDTAARWTIKGNERHYGYKNHIAIDTKSKFVKNYQTTPANVHDSQVIGVLVDPNEITLADSAYTKISLVVLLVPNTLTFFSFS